MEDKTQYRITIPAALRRMSNIANSTSVAVMILDKDTMYLLPEENYGEGDLLGIRQLDNKNRLNISSIWHKRGRYNFYLRRGVIHVWWPED